MGHAVAWVALQLDDPHPLYEAFGVAPAGKQRDLTGFPLVVAVSPTGWIVVLANLSAGAEDRLFDEAFTADLSRLGPMVWCFSESHTMDSAASGWVDGRRTWTVQHDPEQGSDHVHAVGAVPGQLQDVRGTDAFEVPTELARALTGFHHGLEGLAVQRLVYLPQPGGLPPTNECAPRLGFRPSVYDLGGTEQPWPTDDPDLLQALVLKVAADFDSFLIVRGEDDSYMQTAQTPDADGRLMLEWQHSSAGATLHFRLLRRPGPFGEQDALPMSFSPEEALAHLQAFVQRGVPGPGAFLQDVTREIFGG
ncbi:MAG: hypothetical protein ACE37F_09340 [Nannocystaceae bacterium]|nr:hypothetical protein [bacterium]